MSPTIDNPKVSVTQIFFPTSTITLGLWFHNSFVCLNSSSKKMIRPNEHIVVKTCTLNGLLLQNKSIDPKTVP
ncbi:hypothetical protein BLOT_005442 [Blomia tropicalis]|nr:hypothetical protein BLOT_005442 [Blomia tropicalis]